MLYLFGALRLLAFLELVGEAVVLVDFQHLSTPKNGRGIAAPAWNVRLYEALEIFTNALGTRTARATRSSTTTVTRLLIASS